MKGHDCQSQHPGGRGKMIIRGPLSLPREVLFQNQKKQKERNEHIHMGTDDRRASGPDTKPEARASFTHARQVLY